MKNKIKFLTVYILGLLNPPIFIVGCSHSGTSIILSILDNHKDLSAITYESKVFMYKVNYTKFILWYKRIGWIEKKWIEKTPSHILKIDQIFNLFPWAKVILMLRDGRDVACSLKNRTGDFEEGINRWISYNNAWESYENDKRIFVLKLEDFIENKGSSIKRLSSFLKINYEPSILQNSKRSKKFFNEEEVVKTDGVGEKDHVKLRNWQINQEIFSSSSRWRAEMNESEKEICKKNAQNLLKKFRYVESDNW